MDYEKKYKEALEKAKEFYALCEKCGAKDTVDFLEDSFPELKESEDEDERMKKSIIQTLKKYSKCVEDGNDSPSAKDFLVKDIENQIAWLEKQGKKETLCDKCRKEHPSHSCQDITALGRCALEKQDEQKQKQYDIDILEKHITKDSISELAHTVIVRNGWEIVDAREQKPYGQRKECEDCQFNYAGECKGSCQMKRDEQKPADKAESMEHGYITTNPEFFQWIYDRLKYVYNENPNVDYMLSLKERIEDMQKFADKIKPKFKVDDWIIDNKNRVGIIVRILDGHYIISFDGREVQIPFEWEGKLFRKWTIQDAKDGDVLAEDTCTFIIKKLNHDLTAEIYCCLYDDGDFELNSNLGFDDRCTYPATKEQRDLLFQKMKEAGYEWDAEKKEVRLLITNGGDFFESENCDQKPAEWKQENREELTEFENAMMHIGESFFGENAGLDPNDTNTIKEQAELLLKLAPKTEWNEEDEKNLQGIIDEIQANKNNAPSYDIPVYEGFLNWLKSRKQKIGG